MASLKCSKCGEGIHYHSISQDIEYICFSKQVWEYICSTRFDKNNKEMDESGVYPKLFRSSTIENDFKGQYLKLWKCPICGTLHQFSKDGNVIKVYVRDGHKVDIVCYEEGSMFNDYLWDEITEKDVPNDCLTSEKPSLYVRYNEHYLILSEKLDFSNCVYYKMYAPDWMNNESLI